MALLMWEIVLLVLTLVSLCAASVYFIVRCLKSIRAVSKEAKKRSTNPVPKWRQPNLNATQVYGVPYRPPTPPTPLPLDPARLEALVMGHRSDVHPKYLEHDNGFGEISADRLGDSLDQQVSWRGESALLDSEFVPSMTESPMTEIRPDNSSVVSVSPRPKKMLHISYSRGTDGAPEITNITTSVIPQQETVDIESPKSTDEVTNSTPKTPPDERSSVVEGSDPERQDHRIRIKAPHGRWIAFDEDIPSVVVQDENGFVHQRLEFDA